MTEPVAFNVHIRLGADGEMRALTDWEIDDGIDITDYWTGEGPYREVVISVTATLPKAADGEAPDASVSIPDEAPSAVTAAA